MGIFAQTAKYALHSIFEAFLKVATIKKTLGRVCKLTMDPRHSSIRLFRKAASELLCKHALVLKREELYQGLIESGWGAGLLSSAQGGRAGTYFI
jgi:hypothetical protein